MHTLSHSKRPSPSLSGRKRVRAAVFRWLCYGRRLVRLSDALGGFHIVTIVIILTFFTAIAVLIIRADSHPRVILP